MAKKLTKGPPGNFVIEGRIQLEELERLPQDVQLAAYAFSSAGKLLGQGAVGKKGEIRIEFSIPGIDEAEDVELVVAPAGDPKSIRKSSGYRLQISADKWKQERGKYIFKPEVFIRRTIWWPWLPRWICISGHVRKLITDDGITDICPVPFVKVEVFDVDREFCWWPYFRRWWDLLIDKRVFRIPELLKERKTEAKPFPGPDPVSVAPSWSRHLGELSPRRESPPIWEAMRVDPRVEFSGKRLGLLSPQREPPNFPQVRSAEFSIGSSFERVGEARLLDAELAARYDHLTLNSKIAPWLILPWCFYSKAKICETTTDESGYFRCCFDWWPFHFRRGRLRFDLKPDIIIKVTQVVDGVERMIYLDPYTSTRWNETNAHIDLWLDDEEIICGSGDDQERPAGNQVFFTRIGDDEVYKIDQITGL